MSESTAIYFKSRCRPVEHPQKLARRAIFLAHDLFHIRRVCQTVVGLGNRMARSR